MPNISITITNMVQIRSAFSKAPRVMVDNLNAAIKKTVLTIKRGEVEEYRSLGINVITGGLIGSIQRGQYFTNLRGEVGPNVTGSPGVRYALYVHSGTRSMRPRPFLLNAVQATSNNIGGYFKKAVQDTLDGIGKEV